MPFTPLHFGPGFFIKSVLRRYFSFFVFAVVQGLIDLEVVFNIFTSNQRLHTILHTYLGSLLVIPVTWVSVIWFNRLFPKKRIGLTCFVLTALISVWTHVFLDSIMHGDITPFAPFTNNNIVYGLVSYTTLFVVCVVAGGTGLFIYLVRGIVRLF